MEDLLRRRRKRRDPWRLIGRSTVSVICVCVAQFALYLISSFFKPSNIITLLFLSGSQSTCTISICICCSGYYFRFDFDLLFCLVMALIGMAGIGRRCKRLFGLRGSAPAFVFANLFFIWCVYVFVIQQGCITNKPLHFSYLYSYTFPRIGYIRSDTLSMILLCIMNASYDESIGNHIKRT